VVKSNDKTIENDYLMSEKTIKVEGVDLVMLFGANNKKMERLSNLFPSLKIIARGNIIKVIGKTDEILLFKQKFDAILKHVSQYESLTISQMERLVLEDDNNILSEENDLILHGQKGRLIKARTVNQRKMVKQSEENDMLFAIGPAGTGKTYTAVALAVRALKQKQVRKIILTRPAVEAGENLGFLPGDLKEKLDPYLQPLYDALLDMVPPEKLVDYTEHGIIQIAPLAFMRGRTLDNAFVILDEAQNSTESQMKMFLTRMGKSAKFVITGDVTQIDLPKHQSSGLVLAQKILQKMEGIGFVILDERDIIRHTLVKKIIKAFHKPKKEK
jgi:phosphate starvation-inducible PhoH-like protein|tara:strand:- start:1472 stop:2458 length:987 start_codon:yes stop_codon:yes gene_type:complete